MKKIFNKQFNLILGFIFLFEIFSFFGYLLPDFRQIAFLIIVTIVLIFSLQKLEYGIFIILAELFISSKGYLFYFEYGGIILSIRIAFWLIVMAVWAGKIINEFFVNKNLKVNLFKSKKSSDFSYFFVLFIFIAWGFINGFLNKNGFNNIFFDFNSWLYFSLIFPLFYVLKDKNNFKILFNIFSISILWLCIKTFFILFIFSHNLSFITEVYRWIRITGVGEITQMQGGFSRIFFQSHIFVLIGFFIFLFFITDIILKKKNYPKKSILFYFFITTTFLTLVIVSFSRSFWIGLAVGFLFYYFIILFFYKANWKKIIILTMMIFSSGILSVVFIVGIVKFPYPKPMNEFLTTELLMKRVSEMSGEAAISSRWLLLPALWGEIKSAPILGRGFGSVVTYETKDPRALEQNKNGKYTTYAFEWGWLDIWLKLGVFGFLAYFVLIAKIIYNGLKIKENKNQWIIYGLTSGLIIISVVSIFSPYTNHPIGIGFLLLASLLIGRFLKQ